MELNACPECNRPVTEQTSKCIHCGQPLAMKTAYGGSTEPAREYVATTPMRVPKPATDPVSHEPAGQFMATVPIQVKPAEPSYPDEFLATTPMLRNEVVAAAPVVPLPKKSAPNPPGAGTRSPAVRLMHRLLKRDENT